MNPAIETYFRSASDQDFVTDKTTNSRYWALKMRNLMFTYFEVPPNQSFAAHSHESEQITYVLSGKLFFDVEGVEYCVGAGDVISIPSFKVHSVWTNGEGVRAVDAWSPVNEAY